MEVALLLLLPLVGGYFFAKEVNFIKFEVAREDGHRFYFTAAYYGLVCFLVSVILFMLLKTAKDHISLFNFLDLIQEFIIDIFAPMLKEQKQARGQINFSIICLFSIFVGRFSPMLINRLMRTKGIAALKEAAAKDEFEGLLVDAISGQKMISVTLSTGKVYAGQPIGTAEPRSSRKAIAMLPLVSGYRDDDGKLNLTTHYDQIFSEANDAGDYRLILPIDKIISAAFFDALVYERFNDIKPQEKKPSSPQRSVLLEIGILLMATLAEKTVSAWIAKLMRKNP